MANKSGKTPWKTIWTSPRETIRDVVRENANKGLWILAGLYGFSSLLNGFQSFSFGTMMGVFPILLLALVLSPIWGYLAISAWSYIVFWTGKLFKGSANFQKVRAANLWACVPYIGTDLIWILMTLLFGAYLYISPPILYSGQAMIFMVLSLGKVVFSVWALVIYINALSEVQGFSILRAIGNILVSFVLVAVILSLLWSLGAYFFVDPSDTGVVGSTFNLLKALPGAFIEKSSAL